MQRIEKCLLSVQSSGCQFEFIHRAGSLAVFIDKLLIVQLLGWSCWSLLEHPPRGLVPGSSSQGCINLGNGSAGELGHFIVDFNSVVEVLVHHRRHLQELRR
jgi:hypothetical protein